MDPVISNQAEFEQELDKIIELKIKAIDESHVIPVVMEANWKKYFEMKELLIEKWIN